MCWTRSLGVLLALVAAVAGCAAEPPGPLPLPPASPSPSLVPPSPAQPSPLPQPQPDPLLAPALAGAVPVAAPDPATLVQQITVAESAVADPARPPEQLDAGARLAQVAYRALGERPDWDAPVLAAVPPQFHESVIRNAGARRELLALDGDPGDTLPPWRIVEPLPAAELRGYYLEAEQRFGVPWTVLASVNLIETGMGRIIGLSSAGAQGPMQFIPETWERYGMGGDVWDTRDAIMGAANYLEANGGASGTEEGLDRALYRYNNDTRYVRGVRHYAALMAANERAYLGFHAWSVYFRTSAGDILLPVGYEQARSIPVAEWLPRPG